MLLQNTIKRITAAAASVLMAGITCFPVTAAVPSSLYGPNGKYVQEISAECGGKEFTVSADFGVLPHGTTLSVTECSDKDYTDAVMDLEGKEHVCDADIYDISLKDADGKEFEPDHNVHVTFEDAEEGLGKGESVSVYHFEGDDTDRAEKLRVKKAGEDAVVKTDSFSKFAVVRRAAAVTTVTLDTGANVNAILQKWYSAKKIVFTRTAPGSGVTTKDISSGGGVLAYLDGTTINIYVPATISQCKFNADSSAMFKKMYSVQAIGFSSLVDTSNVTDMNNMFADCQALTTLDVSGFDTSHVTDMGYMFYNCQALTTLDVSKWDTSKVTNMQGLFMDCRVLQTLNLTQFNTANVTSMEYMFESCYALTSLDLSNFNTSNVTIMKGMFSSCKHLTTLDVSSFDTSKVTNMDEMFRDCEALPSVDISSFTGDSVTAMSEMFAYDPNLKSIDLSSFAIKSNSHVNMSSTFYGCTSLTSIDLTGFSKDTQAKVSFLSTFYGCTSLKAIKLDGLYINGLKQVFQNCSALTSLDFSKATVVGNVQYAFSGCNALTTLDISSFDTSKITNQKLMFNQEYHGSLAKVILGEKFYVPSSQAYTGFLPKPEKTISGKTSNNLWGLGSEKAATTYDIYQLSKLGSTAGSYTGAWYAQAAPTYTISFNANGGTGTTASVEVSSGQAMPSISNKMSRTGYTFAGYYDDPTSGTQYYTANNTSTKTWDKTADTTLYAHWTVNKYTITFNSNGGSGTTSSVTATYGSAMPAISNKMSRTNYAFDGYYDAASGGTQYYTSSNASARTWNKTANTTLYAHWHALSSTVTFNANGGTGTTASVQATNGSAMPSITNGMSRTGYTFVGYYDAATGGTQYYTANNSSARTWDKNADTTLYAHWTINTYKISYTLNGGSATNPTSYQVDTATFTLSNPTRTGYTFAGWTGSNGTTKQTAVSIAKGSTGDKTYTANWTANTNTKYTVIHQQEQLDGSYTTIETQNLIGTTGASVTPAVKSYTGFTAPATQTVTINPAGTTSVTYKYSRNSYTITRQYRLENADGSFGSYTQIDSKTYKYGAAISAWNRAADTTYKAASIAAYTVSNKNDTLSVNVMRNTSTNNVIQYRLQNADGSYPTAYTAGWSGTLRYGESHTWTYAQTASHQAISQAVGYNGGTVNVNVPRRTGRLAIHANGGTGDRTTSAILYGASDKISPLPTRTGYTLTGLFTAASGGTKVVNADGTLANDGTYSKDGAWFLTADVDVYAQWKANQYTVTCEDWFVDASNNRKVKLGSSTKSMDYGTTANGTAWGTDSATSKYYAGYVYKSATTAPVTTSGATVYRYFWAWTNINVYNAEGIETQNVATFSLSSDGGKTWQTGLKNENTHSENDVIKPYGTTYVIKDLVPINTYEEYDSCVTATYSNGQWTYTPKAGNTCIDLKMKYKTYTISYNLNGGTDSGNPTSYTYATTDIKLKDPTRKGYTFLYWTLDGDSTGKQYSSADVAVALHSTGNKTFTAHWQDNPYTVTIPKKVAFTDMNVGSVNHIVTIPVTVSGDYPGTVSVTSAPGTLSAPDQRTLNMDTDSHKNAITFTAGDGAKNDTLMITGIAKLDTYSGIVKYNVTQQK